MVKQRALEEFWFVDYCGNCKDLDVMSPCDIPCHHPWYCWHDNGEVQELEYKLGVLREKQEWNRFLTASEKIEYSKLKKEKFELVKRKLKEYRRLRQT